MSKDWDLTQEGFDQLLNWFDPDRDKAGKKYEEIRRGIVKVMTVRRCLEAEVIADETFNRVVRKLPEIIPTYVGDPALYCFGVANKIYLEWLKKQPAQVEIPAVLPAPPHEDKETENQCFEQCLNQLLPKDRLMIIEYYRDEKQQKIDHRKELAEQLGISENALRLRAFRLRGELTTCVKKCREKNMK